MKNIFLCALALGASTLFAQGPSIDGARAANFLNTIDNQGSTFGSSSLFRNPSNTITGSVHLFDDWSNKGIAVISKDQKVAVNKLNINVQRNTVEARINTDSIFTFNLGKIDRVIIQNRTFKQVYFPIKESNRLLEIIGSSDDLVIYKDYEIDINEGNPNPMRGAQKDRFIIRDQYYAQIGDTFKKFKLKKKTILKAVGAKADEVEAFAKENNYSFRKDEDVARILQHYNTL